MTSSASIVAFAGRRIDAPGSAAPRFPSDQLERVARELGAFFDARSVRAVVGSAACGADILILEAARERGLETHIVLPFDAARFRETSVIDRGRDWGPRYDQALAYAAQRGRVIVIAKAGGSDDDAYARATEVIFDTASALTRDSSGVALAVWDQNPRATEDATLQFLDLAKQRQFECVEIRTV